MARLLRWINLAGLVGVMLLAASVAAAQSASPLNGTWQLNLPNSMYDPGPPPKSVRRTQQINGDSITVNMEIVEEDGQSRQVQYTAKLDGSDYPITGALNADTIAFKRIDDRTLEFTQKKEGKETMKGKQTVSDDGVELTISAKGENAKGEEFINLMVFDKKR